MMECFQKIGTAATTTEGLEKLYDLLAEHPKMPVNDLLERTSEQFQRYIQKGIDKARLFSPCGGLESLLRLRACRRRRWESGLRACRCTRSGRSSARASAWGRATWSTTRCLVSQRTLAHAAAPAATSTPTPVPRAARRTTSTTCRSA